MRRVLICGDRNWTNYPRIDICVRKANATARIDVIIEGEARGADRMAHLAANAADIEVLSFPARWDEEGRAAGVIRNQRMLDEGKPTEVWAFHNDLLHSRGTLDMVTRSRKAGLEVWEITDNGYRHYYGKETLRSSCACEQQFDF